MYKPKLNYIFCLSRKRSLMPSMSIMRYMNSIGIVPQLLIADKLRSVPQHSLITKELDLYKIKYKEIKSLPNYDVMFSEGGTIEFDRHWLIEGKKRGKINALLQNGTVAFQYLKSNMYHQKFVEDKLFDIVCAKIEKSVLYEKEFFKPIQMVNVGDPDWDWWQTDEFRDKVRKVKSTFGDKIFVFGGLFVTPQQAIPYVKLCIEQAKKLGFKFVISPHPDRWTTIPKEFYKYCNWDIHHHVLFKAASHIVSSITCSLIAEGSFLGSKVGCESYIAHCDGWGKHRWLDRNSWFAKVAKHVDSKLIDLISPVFDKEDLCNFLSSSKPKVSVESAEKVFGRIKVPCYTAYLLKTLDMKFGK